MTLRQIRLALLLILGMVLVLASVTYSALLQRGYVVVKFSALLIGATALLSLSTYLLAIGRRWRELKDPLIYLLLAEIGVLLLSIATSGQRWVSFLGSMPRLMGAVTIACFVVAGIAVVLAVGERRERLLVLLRVVAVTSAFAGINALYEWPQHPIFRPSGLVGNAEFLSNYLLFGALGAVALLFVERDRRWAWMAIVTSALSAVALAAIKTRGAWLGFGAGVAVLLIAVDPRRLSAELVARVRPRLAWLCLTTLIVAGLAAWWGYGSATHKIGWNLLLPFLPVGGMLFFALPWFLARVPLVRHGVLALLTAAVILTGISVSTQTPILPFKPAEALRITEESARGVVRDDTIRMLSKYWLFGCGIENFRVAFLEFKSERLARADPRVNYRNPHNMLLYEWTANGLAGVLVYLGLLVFGLWGLLVARRRDLTTGWGLFASALLATLVAYTVQNMFNYDVIPTGLHYYVFLGMTLVLRRAAPARDDDDDPSEGDDGSDDQGGGDKSDDDDEKNGAKGDDNTDDAKGDDDKDGDDKSDDNDGKKTKASQDKAANTKATKAGSTRTKASKTKASKTKASKTRATKDAAKKEAKKKARRQSKKEARLAAEREALHGRQAYWLAVGLIGATVLYLLLHHLPPLRDLFRFAVGDNLPDRKDGLGALLVVAWGAGWSLAGLLQPKGRQRVVFLLVGGLGLMAIYAAFYAIPTLREYLVKVPDEAKHVRYDILPAILILAWTGFFTIVGLSAEELEPTEDGESAASTATTGAQSDNPDGDSTANANALLRQNSWALALLMVSFVGVGAWWAGRQLKADYAMFRAKAISRTVRGRYIGGLRRIQGSLRQLARYQRQLQQRGGGGAQLAQIQRRQDALRSRQRKIGLKIKEYLEQVQRYGRVGAKTVGVLGYYHFQYSKALHPFLKARGVLDNYRDLVAESLAHARKGVKQNTNPESAWSHVSVVYLAAGKLQAAKRALAKSIEHDPYYYDTHRMMALLHLRDGHIDEAVQEMNRSLDITEGKHLYHIKKSLHSFLANTERGNEGKARAARQRMWYWIHRAWKSYRGKEAYLLSLWSKHEKWERIVRIAKAIENGNRKTQRTLFAARNKRPPLLRIYGSVWKTLRAMRALSADNPTRASRILRQIRHNRKPDDPVYPRFVQLARLFDGLSPALAQYVDPATPSKKLESLRARVVRQATEHTSLTFRLLALHLLPHLQDSTTTTRRTQAKRVSRIIRELYEDKLRDLYSPGFRRRYQQVIRAKQQVDAASTPQGRIRRAKTMLRRRDLRSALRVFRGAIRKYDDEVPEAHFYAGLILERLGRPAEALPLLEHYLKLAPKGEHTDRAKQTINRLNATP